MNPAPKIHLISLGCSKALVDSERVLTKLKTAGYLLTQDENEADLIIINTCAFINEAIDESLETIEETLSHHSHVIVMGCLGNKKDLVLKRFPQVSAIIQPNQDEALLKAIHKIIKPFNLSSAEHSTQPPIKLTPSHYAYLKIAEGCHHNCTFCIIPQLRGPLMSRPINEVLDEAESLVDSGVKELIIIAQDTSAYGIDLHHPFSFWHNYLLKTDLFTLAKTLSQWNIWIRFHYLYPHSSIDTLLPLMADHKILPYFDVPFQHINQLLLKKMKRPGLSITNQKKLLERIAHWRNSCPDLTLRSTFIVGFPGETDEAFEELLNFLAEAQFDRVGCFKYSPVDGAAANTFPNQIPESLKQERLERLLSLQTQISADRLQQKIGKSLPVMIDEIQESQMIGRSQGDSPEIDGEVIIKTEKHLNPGDIVSVMIEEANDHDLFARLLNSN